MSAEDDAAAVLAQVVPIGDDNPHAQALYEAVAADIAARPLRVERIEGIEPCPEFTGTTELIEVGPIDATGVARPGDTLIFGTRVPITAETAERIRAALVERLPGCDVLVVGDLTLEGIYRGGNP